MCRGVEIPYCVGGFAVVVRAAARRAIVQRSGPRPQQRSTHRLWDHVAILTQGSSGECLQAAKRALRIARAGIARLLRTPLAGERHDPSIEAVLTEEFLIKSLEFA